MLYLEAGGAHCNYVPLLPAHFFIYNRRFATRAVDTASPKSKKQA
jgi:hypothetical protein